VRSEKNWKRLLGREAEIDEWMKVADKSVYPPDAYVGRRLEKTILVAASAICEAIWNARA